MIGIEQAQAHFDERMAALSAGGLICTSTVRVELPDGGQADVAIKVLDPVTNDRFVPTGIARYQDGRVVGEAHTSFFSPYSGHRHEAGMCMDFEMADGLFVPSDQTVPLRRDGTNGLAMAYNTIEALESCGSAFDLLLSASALAQARKVQGEGRLFFEPALQAAFNQRLAEAA